MRFFRNCGMIASMFGIAAFIYGLAVSVTLSMCGRNRQLGRSHPPLLRALGYLLCGVSMGAAGGLGFMVASDPASAQGIVPLIGGVL